MLLLAACMDDTDVRTARPGDSPGDTDAAPDTDDDTDPLAETVAVAAPRELRGLYVATVYDIDWPSESGLSAVDQQAEITALLDVAQVAGFNAVFVQVRPEGDALYASSIEPWSRWLSGTQGADPGYDPLELWISAARARGMEVHAWLNPYRAKAGSESLTGFAAGHPAADFPAYAYAYGGDVWMDPGAEEVRGRVVDVVTDLLTHYDLDGIHFDDYFYPYPDDGEFPDDAIFAAYQAGGGTLARDDWRRANTALLVQEVAEAIDALDPAVRFGVAPFGIWRPGYPEGISGFDPYESLYADPLDWAASGWLDYLAPQLYWETGNEGQEYGALAAWWDAQLADTWLFPANALYQLGTSDTWTLDEFAAQIELCRDPELANTRGNLWYNASSLLADTQSVQAAFATRYYTGPALPPSVHGLADAEPAPVLTVDGASVRWAATDRRLITVYAPEGGGWALAAVIPAGEGAVTLTSGTWAVASVSKGDVESEGVVVEVP